MFSFAESQLGSFNNRKTYCFMSPNVRVGEISFFLDDRLLQWFSVCGPQSSKFCFQQPLGRGQVRQSPMRWVSRHPFLLHIKTADLIQYLDFSDDQIRSPEVIHPGSHSSCRENWPSIYQLLEGSFSSSCHDPLCCVTHGKANTVSLPTFYGFSPAPFYTVP